MRYSVRYGQREHWVDVDPEGSQWKIRVDGEEALIDAAELSPGAYSILTNGRSREIAVDRDGDDFKVRLGGATYEMVVLDEVRARTRRPERAAAISGPVQLRAPMPGLVVALKVAVGDEVEKGKPLIVIEAMKMQNELGSPAAGKIEKIHVKPGDSVENSQPLVTVAPPVAAP